MELDNSPSSKISLHNTPADVAAVSFYEVFEFLTGVGGLIAKKPFRWDHDGHVLLAGPWTQYRYQVQASPWRRRCMSDLRCALTRSPKSDWLKLSHA